MHAESMQCILYTYVLSGLKALSMVYQGRRKQLKSGPASYTEAAQRAKKNFIELSGSSRLLEAAQSIHIPYLAWGELEFID